MLENTRTAPRRMAALALLAMAACMLAFALPAPADEAGALDAKAAAEAPEMDGLAEALSAYERPGYEYHGSFSGMPIWHEIEYRVSFAGEGADGMEEHAWTVEAEGYRLPEPAGREGLRFAGWSTTPDGNDVADDPGTVQDEEMPGATFAPGATFGKLTKARATLPDGSEAVTALLMFADKEHALTLFAQWEEGEQAPQGEAAPEDAEAQASVSEGETAGPPSSPSPTGGPQGPLDGTGGGGAPDTGAAADEGGPQGQAPAPEEVGGQDPPADAEGIPEAAGEPAGPGEAPGEAPEEAIAADDAAKVAEEAGSAPEGPDDGSGMAQAMSSAMPMMLKASPKALVLAAAPSKTNIALATFAGFPGYVYTGSAITPSPTLTYAGKRLVAGTDFTVSYRNNISAGTATATITGKGAFSGSREATFRIQPRPISAATIQAIPDQAYTGRAVTPAVTVKSGTRVLSKGTDYTVSYANNVKAGNANATVTGRGNWTGSVTRSFRIAAPAPTWSGASRMPVGSSAAYSVANGTLKVKSGSAVAVSGKVVLAKKAGSATIALVDSTGRERQTKAIEVYPISGNHEIRSAASTGLALDVASSSTANSGRLIAFRSTRAANQVFQFAAQPDGTYGIRALHSGRYLDVPSSSKAKGAGIIQYAWHGGANQRFRIEVDKDNQLTLVNANSNMPIGIRGGKAQSGAWVEQQARTGALYQKWVLADAVRGIDVTMSLNFSKLMLDNWYNNVGEVRATLGKSGVYGQKDIRWKIEDVSGKNVARIVDTVYDNAKRTSSQNSGWWARVRGISPGTAKVTATLPNGRKCECLVQVMAPANVQCPGDTWVGGKYRMWVQKSSTDWGTEYVESYVNNLAHMVWTYPDKSKYRKEAAKKTFQVHTQKGLKISVDDKKRRITKVTGSRKTFPEVNARTGSGYNHRSVTKPYRCIETNGYVFLFSSKNQWGYLLKKDSSGTFHLVCKQKMSAGMVYKHDECYYMDMFNCEYDLTMEPSKFDGSGKLQKWGGYSPAHGEVKGKMDIKRGYPSSNGCTHMGTYKDSEMYYWLFAKAGVGTRLILA